MYRASDGRLLNTNKAKVLMITTPGRRTGVLHSTCVRYLETPGGYLVWGTASGAPRDPDWFRNLRKVTVADVQIGAPTIRARPRELLAEERVGVVPGTAFGPSGAGHVRVCYATAYEEIVEALDRIERFVGRQPT